MANVKLCLLLVIGCFFFTSNSVYAQKAKFKNKRVTVQKTRLPTNYIELENRTYDLYVKGAYATNIEAHDKGIYGWSLDQENPDLEAAVSIYGFRIGSPTVTTEKKESKNKEGKVTDRWTEYTYHGKAEGKGTLYLYGASNPFQYKKKNAKKSKYEEKKEAEAAAQKKALEENSFLSADDVEEAEESDISEDTGLDGAQLPLIERVDLDIETTVKTKAYRSSSAAYKEYRETQKPKLYDFRSSYPGQAYNKAISTLNYRYGYSPVNYKVWMKSMKSEKHPDYKKWNDAVTATGMLFKVFKYNKSIDANQSKFDPIIKYFSAKVDGIDDKDKKGKKMKKAAFNNLTNLLFYLDRYEAVITVCKNNLESKILDKSAKRMMEKAERQVALLAFHKVESCHLESSFEIDESEIESEEDEDDTAADGK
jgi:hypothetical protein